MLLIELSDDELSNYLPSIPLTPENLIISHSMYIQIKGYSNVKFRYLYYPATDDNKEENQIWFAIRYEMQNEWASLYVACSPKHTLSDAKFHAIFDEFDKKNPTLLIKPNQFIIGGEYITQKFLQWSTEKHTHKYQLFYGYNYYLDESGRKELGRIENIDLPEDFYFDKPDLETDSTKILKNYPHSLPQNEESMRAKMEHLPCAIVRHQKTQKLAAYYLVEPYGILTLHYTYPEFRNQGLGKAIELKLIKNCLDYGFPMPFKFIELYNESLIASHKTSKIWKRWEEEDGIPIKITFAITKEDS